MLRIASDIDGVIAACGQAMLDYNIKLGIVPEGTIINNFPMYGVEKFYNNFSLACFDEHDFWATMPLFNDDEVGDSKKFVEQLHSLGELTFVSACFHVSGRNEWITKNGLHTKGFVSMPGKQKAAYAISEKFDVFIEDHPKTVIDLCEAGIQYVYCVKHNYNKELEEYKHNNLKVRGNLNEIIKDIEYVSRNKRSNNRNQGVAAYATTHSRKII